MIKINNKKYSFKFGFKAMVAFEEGEGKPFSEMSKRGNSLLTIVALAYYGINAASKEQITREELIDAIDQDETLLETIMKVAEKDMGAANSIKAEAKK